MNRESRSEELELLALEVSDVKETLREMSRQILRIERRVNAALPRSNDAPSSPGRPKLDTESARRTISRLKERAGNGGQIEGDLRRMTVKNELAVLARELGLTNTKLPAKDDLVRRIATRIRQGSIVTRGLPDTVGEKEARSD